jgi:hypothetical protein
MNATDTYKILYNLPKIPKNYLTELQNLYSDNTKTLYNVYPSADYVGRTLQINDRSIVSTQSNRYKLSTHFTQWIQDNIVDDWTECSFSITHANNTSAVHGAHIDHSRTYLLLYLVEPGGQNATVTWYQEHGYPVFRPDALGRTVCNYSDLTTIDQFQPPLHTWVVYNVRILHGVENLDSDRIGIQIGLTEKNYDSLLTTL